MAKKKENAAVKAPLYINGRYVVEKTLAAKPAQGTAPYAAAEGKVKVTLVKSPIGTKADHRATLAGLGLKKIRQSRVLEDTPAVRGMINKVAYLVRAE